MGATLPLLPRDWLKSLREVSEEMLLVGREYTIEHDKQIIDEILKEGKLYAAAGLVPTYLYDESTMTFTVTSKEYLNSLPKMN